MTRITEVVVERRQLATAALRTRNLPAPEALAEGQALLAVGEFALTANNVTYAALGDALRYWEFFPAGEGWASSRSGASPRCLPRAARGSNRASASMATIRWPATCWSRRRRSAAAASSTPASTAGTSRRSTTSTCAAAATRSTGPPTRPCRSPAAAVHHLVPARRLPRRAYLVRRHRPAAEQCLEQDRHRPGLPPPAQSCATRPGLPHRRPDLRGQPRLRRRPGLL